MKWFVLLMLMSGSVQAEIFKCVNAAGKKTYQQSPCEVDDKVEGYKFREVSKATKASAAKARKEDYASKLQKKYNSVKVKMAEMKGRQIAAQSSGMYRSASQARFYTGMLSRYIAEIEMIKMEAKEKGVKLY